MDEGYTYDVLPEEEDYDPKKATLVQAKVVARLVQLKDEEGLKIALRRLVEVVEDLNNST